MQFFTPRIVDVFCNNSSAIICQCNNIALHIQHIVVCNRIGCAVRVDQRERSAGFVIDKVNDFGLPRDFCLKHGCVQCIAHNLAILRQVGMGLCGFGNQLFSGELSGTYCYG